MRELIKKYEADMVICTHPFPCAAASYLKQTGEINIPLITVMTDFCVHQFWLYKNIDIYFTANDLLKKRNGKSRFIRRTHFCYRYTCGI